MQILAADVAALEWWKAVILGAVQGLTELLPIISSAHLLLVPWFFGWDNPGLTFDVALHIGTLAAVLLYFRSDLWIWRGRSCAGSPAGNCWPSRTRASA